MIIKCPECGRDFSDKAQACPQCGCPLSEATAVKTERIDDQSQHEASATTAPTKCPKCGREIPSSVKAYKSGVVPCPFCSQQPSYLFVEQDAGKHPKAACRLWGYLVLWCASVDWQR